MTVTPLKGGEQVDQKVNEEEKSKDGGTRVKERGVNNNSLYDSLLEGARGLVQVKRERSESLKRSENRRRRKRRSLENRANKMASPSRSESRSRSRGARSKSRFKNCYLL